MRVLRAFFQALWLTLQGKTLQPSVPPIRYPHLEIWRQSALERLQTVWRVAEKAGWDETQRKAFTLTLDSRKMSADTLLKGVEHNLVREYPLLLTTDLDHTLTTLYALNLNDRYRVGQLAQAQGLDSTVQSAIQALHGVLEGIPSSKAHSER
jgi:hypothetical protein